MAKRLFRADLHIHSVLSPCAERDMLPHCILLEAIEKGLDMIAVTDHNACENVEVSVSLGKRFGVWVIPGMEVETREEIHFLTFFPTFEKLTSFYQSLQRYFSRIPLDENIWGEEWVIDEDGRIVEKKDYLLTYPFNLSVEELFTMVLNKNGIIIPSHIDRGAYSIIGVLGFIPSDCDFPVLEVSQATSISHARKQYSLDIYNLVRFSDAHTLPQIGQVYSEFRMCDCNWGEFRKAIAQEEGRNIIPRPND